MIHNALIGIMIAILPLYIKITDFESNRASKDVVFILFCFMSILFLKNKRKITDAKLLAPMVYSVFVLVYSLSFNLPSVGIFNAIASLVSIFYAAKYMQSFSTDGFRYILDGMIIGSIIQSIIGIFGYFGIELYPYVLAMYNDSFNYNVPSIGSGNVVGGLGNNNLLASYLCISFPAFFTRKHIKYLCVIPLTALLLSQSWMGVASLFAGIAFYFLMKYKKDIYSLAIAVMIILPFFKIGIDSGRFNIWRQVVSLATPTHWVFGAYPGWFLEQKLSNVPTEVFEQEHNSYLTIFNVFGLSIFILLIPLFFLFIKKKLNPLLEVFLFIIFCNSWGHFTIQQSTVMIMIIPILCISIISLYEKDFDKSIY